MSFFTSICLSKDQLLVRGYDSLGDQISYKTSGDDMKLKLYGLDVNGDSKFKTLAGQKLKEISFDSIGEFQSFKQDFGKKLDLHGDFSIPNQYITQNRLADEPDVSKIRIGIFDIETESIHGFPNVVDPIEQIIVISCHSSRTNIIHCFVLGEHGKNIQLSDVEVKMVNCQSERELIFRFLDYWKEEKFDIVSGWNVQGFDSVFLYHRIKKVLSKKEANQLSFWNHVSAKTKEKNNKVTHSVDFYGTTILDYLELYKKFVQEKRESYKLDSIAEYELNENKLEYSEFDSIQEFWEKDPEKFVLYNIQDTMLVVRLNQKLKLLHLAFTFSYIAKQNYSDVFSPIRTWDSLCYNYLYEKNIAVPPSSHTGKSESFAGAYVKESQPGLFKDVVSLDVNSLYPSVIRMLNISPETLVQKIVDPSIQNQQLVEQLKNSELKNYSKHKENDFTLSANGQFFRKDKKGMIPEIMENLIKKRKEANSELIKMKLELEEINKQLEE